MEEVKIINTSVQHVPVFNPSRVKVSSVKMFIDPWPEEPNFYHLNDKSEGC